MVFYEIVNNGKYTSTKIIANFPCVVVAAAVVGQSIVCMEKDQLSLRTFQVSFRYQKRKTEARLACFLIKLLGDLKTSYCFTRNGGYNNSLRCQYTVDVFRNIWWFYARLRSKRQVSLAYASFERVINNRRSL